MENISEKKKVCIIGAGVSGLCALRRLLESPTLEGTIIEQKDDIGGLWYYTGSKVFPTSRENLTPDTEMDKDPECVTSMYDDLIGNIFHPLMQLGDFKHTKVKGAFATQKEIYEHFRDFANHFNLWPNIQLNTAVVSVRPENPNIPEGLPDRWIVKTHNHKDDVYTTTIYDSLIICTGKCTYPYSPIIPGMDEFKGKIMHFKYFKNAEEFRGKNIVCIGLGPSSSEVVLLISKFAAKVTVCHKFPGGYKLGLLPPNTREVKSVKVVTSNGVVTEEDESIPCDVILLCTGYVMKYPFMHPDCGLVVKEGKYIPHLYEMLIFTKRPTLALLNMCYRSPEILQTDIQARYYIKVLEGVTKLPVYEEMENALKAEETRKEEQGLSYSEWFQVGDFGIDNWKYFLRLAEEIGVRDEYKNYLLFEKVWFSCLSRLFGKVVLYKSDTFKMVDGKSFEHIFSTSPEYPDSKPGKTTIVLNPDSTVTVETTEL